MPRNARIDATGALHHIIARGIERRKIFRTQKDSKDFLSRLANIVVETRTECYAWALIPNHFHLLLKTGAVPIATVMRRLLTGYAVSFNLRHRRHGHVFQNRYKSILCQEDTYLLELVRYIHLNPLRAGLVPDVESLGRFAYAGHGAITGERPYDWQSTAAVLRLFGDELNQARERYRRFVKEGEAQGRQPALTGGGLIRSLGGWEAVKSLGKERDFHKSDERILGDSDFVEGILRETEEVRKKQQALQDRGINFDQVLQAVARISQIPAEEIMAPGKDRPRVKARSLLCHWAVQDLGMSRTALARKTGLSVAAIAMAVRRGGELVREHRYSLDQTLNFKT